MRRPVLSSLAALAVTVLLAACQTVEEPRPVASAPIPVIERSRTEAVRDDVLKSQITRRIVEQGRAFRSIAVEAWGGRVLLMGAVIKPEQRRKAEQLARATDGVTTVLNELVLAEDKALDAFAPDPARDTATRRALGMESGTGTIVRVINGVAFLLGATPTAEAAAAMKADATEIEGIKWVVSHLSVQP
ncbi:MAG: BON domain-containing protein [Rhodospirillaceae bacterium]|nr:BON domain-containing protein [Rhodospirillales bacterium]